MIAGVRREIGAAGLLLVATTLLFVILWATTLLGRNQLVGGDILYGVFPWAGTPGAKPPQNFLLGDPVRQMLPWLGLVRDSLLHGHLPLWNPTAGSGTPLLANDQSAPFSPATLLTLPFSSTYGYSLAMLAKLWFAGWGTWLFLRALGAGRFASLGGGIAYATSSFMVVWLAWPHTTVAAIMPWAFAFAERFLGRRKFSDLIGLALVIGLQFLGGHSETSLHFGAALVIYCAIRWLSIQNGRWLAFAGLGVAAAVGCMLAAIQLLPFLAFLSQTTLSADRISEGIGMVHLSAGHLVSWLMPNGHGNPGIDGALGWSPNYNEGTGYAGLWALLLSPLGAIWIWRRSRSAAVALLSLGLGTALTLYGPLYKVVGRIPGFSSANTGRMTVVLCFVVAVLGGLGLDALLGKQELFKRWTRWITASWGRAFLALGAAAELVVIGCALLFWLKGSRVEKIHGGIHIGNYVGFWEAFAAASFVAVVSAALYFLSRPNQWIKTATVVVGAQILIEAAVFAAPYNPRVPASEMPPASSVISWLSANQGPFHVAAEDPVMLSETDAYAGVNDSRFYDVLVSPRQKAFWQTADPTANVSLTLDLRNPAVNWLAAAGVRYYVNLGAKPLPGTTAIFSNEGVTVGEVPGARPFAFTSSNAIGVADQSSAQQTLAKDPLGPVVVEGGDSIGAGSQSISPVNTQSTDPELIAADVSSAVPTTLVLLQSFDSGWSAYVDGIKAVVHPADILFQAVQLPAGKHHVELRYQPASVVSGMALSGAGLMILVMAVAGRPVWRRVRRRR